MVKHGIIKQSTNGGVILKKWMWVLVAAVIAIGVGGYTYSKHREQTNAYTTAMRYGKLAIQDKNYSQAESFFSRATRTKANDPVAQRYLTQTQTYVDGANAIKERQFSQAKTSFTTVTKTKTGSDVWVKRAKTELKLIKRVVKKRATYQKEYKKALELNQTNEFTDSNGVLTVLFQSKTFSESYYKDIYKAAKALRKQNNAALKSLTSSTPVVNNGSSQSSSSSESSSSTAASASSSSSTATSKADSSTSGLTSSEKKAANNYSGSNEYTVTNSQQQVNGSSVTSNQIKATRSELKEAGIDADALSDQDVRTVLQTAASDHISPVQAAKKLFK